MPTAKEIKRQGVNARLLALAATLDAEPAALVCEAANEIDRLRGEVEVLLSYLHGISRQTSEMVKDHSS